MTVTRDAISSESRTPSRRALLAGAVGGIGAWAAGVIGRASPARAGVDGDVVLGAQNVTALETQITNNTNSNNAFVANNTGGGHALRAHSTGANALFADSNATDEAAIFAWSNGNPPSTAVQGISGGGNLDPKPHTGVYGYAASSTSSRGVWGESTSGIGVYGRATNGFAGYFHGKVFTNSFHELQETATPPAPPVNRARLFVRDVGGKTQLCVRFATGSVKLLAQEA